MKLHYALPALFSTALFFGCSGGDEDPPVDTPDTGVVEVPDTGPNPQPDAGPEPDAGPAPDMGVEPDTGVNPDADVPDRPTPDVPAPIREVEVSGRVTRLGSYLGGENAYVGAANVLSYGVVVDDPTTVSSADAPTLGQYALTVPANGQIVFFSSRQGYHQTFTTVTTQEANIQNQRLYLAENDWLAEIATAHNVNTNNAFACQTVSLMGEQCVYAAIVGRILDDGAAGNGELRPVGGVERADFTITGGNANAPWYVRGPYFLSYEGTSAPQATESIVYRNGQGEYLGGLFLTFVEVPQAAGDQYVSIRMSISYDDGGVTRYFGPRDVQAFRSPGTSVTFTSVYESGVAPPPPVNDIDFDTQVYPLFLPVSAGGLGCVGCHTNQGGVAPSGGMNLYGGPDAAFASLDPANYPARVNIASPRMSLLLQKPLYEAQGPQDHPIFAFTSEQDPGYQLIYNWIREGAIRNVVLPPVSFANDIRPLLYNTPPQGGAGCRACHFDGVNAATAPGGFYMGGTPADLYAALVNTAPTDNGATGELYRINKTPQYPERSLVLTNPLFGNAEPHPVKIFSANTDPRYQLIYRWIVEGYQGP